MLFIEDSLQNSDEVVSFIKFSVILNVIVIAVVSVNATRLKENLLKLNPNLKTTSRTKKIFDSFKDDFVAALEYSREHSLQNNAIQLGELHILDGIKFLKNIGITSVTLLITVRMNQSQLRRITENTHIPSLSLSQLVHSNTV